MVRVMLRKRLSRKSSMVQASILFFKVIGFVAIVAAVAGVPRISLLGAESEGPTAKLRPKTSDMTPVSLQLVGQSKREPLKLQVPKAYLSNIQDWKGGEQSAVSIETGLPDLAPRRAVFRIGQQSSEEELASQMRALNNGLRISLYGGVAAPGTKERIYLSSINEYVKLDKKLHGLEQFRRQHCTENDDAGTQKSSSSRECRYVGKILLFTVNDDDETWIRLRCGLVELWPVDGCTATTLYRGRLVNYIFRASELGRWREFDRAVRTLLDGFVVA